MLVQNKRKEAFDELTISVPAKLLDPNENDEEASRAASALGGRFLQVSKRVIRYNISDPDGPLIYRHFFEGSSRQQSSFLVQIAELRLGRGSGHG